MSHVQRATDDTINSIRKRAQIKLKRQDLRVSIQGTSPAGQPFDWTVVVGWTEKGKFQCEVGVAQDIHDAVELCLDKFQPPPDLGAILGYTEATL